METANNLDLTCLKADDIAPMLGMSKKLLPGLERHASLIL